MSLRRCQLIPQEVNRSTDSPRSKAQSVLEEVWPPRSEEDTGEPVEPTGIGGSPMWRANGLIVQLVF